MNQIDFKITRRSGFFVGVSISLGILALACLNLIPFYPGCVFTVFALVSNILNFACYMGPYTIQLHFCNALYTLAPIWVLILDPCAVRFAQSLTAINICFTAIEQRDRRIRGFFTALMSLSWLFVLSAKGTLIGECEESLSKNFGRDSIVTSVVSLLLVAAFSVQIDTYFKATKEALGQVRDLNSKLESLNGDLKQLLADKDNFILLFSHETRNPLNILLGNLALLLDEVDAPQVKNKIIRCKFCADLLLQHLNNILDTGKLANKGTLEVTPTPVRVYEYLQSTSSFMEMLVKKKGSLKPGLMIPQKLPSILRFDMQRLTQVILNLLTNAVKFTDNGSITMVVRYLKKNSIEESDYYPTTAFGYQLLNKPRTPKIDSSSEFFENPMGSDIQLTDRFRREICTLEETKNSSSGSDAGGQGLLKIEICDTGCGIKTEDINKLFRKFSQVHSEGAQSAIGSGLGLWITEKLCELMNGGIRVYSKPRVGTCFSVLIQADSLPVQPRILTGPQTTPNELISSPTFFASRRVLLADDDPYNLEFHAHIMKELGFEQVETAIDGQDLVNKFKMKPEGYFEVVITDVSMPQIDGIQAASKIREFESVQKRKRKVKIGFITGHSNPTDKGKCAKEPISSLFYLSKPIKSCMLEGFFDFKSSSSPRLRKPSRPLKKEEPLILCVDDDVFNLDCLSEMLGNLGAKTIKTKSGEESLSKFEEIVLNEKGKRLNFVLMDCRMGGMDGWTASHRMKEMLRSQNKGNIPIIGLSGEEKARNLEKFRFSGMDDMLQKPVTKAELQRLLTKYTETGIRYVKTENL